jgi:periplasmic protein TonB
VIVTNAPDTANVPSIPPPPPPVPPAPPAPPAPAAPTIVQKGVPSTYYNMLTSVIGKAFSYPVKAVRDEEEGSVSLRLHIARDGHVVSTEVISRSGFVTLDRDAVDTIRRVGRFPAFPSDVGADVAEVIVDIPIQYTLE